MMEDIRELEIFQFGDESESCQNRRRLFGMSYTNRILYEIAEEGPFFYSDFQLAEAIHVNHEIISHRMKELCKEGLVRRRDDKYCLNFPVFLKEDVMKLNLMLPEIVEKIGGKIEKMKEILQTEVKHLKMKGQFRIERLLYHILCDQIFDGYAFDVLEKQGMLSQKNICIGYEKSPFVAGNSNRLLCSSNNVTFGRTTFNSFGDADGERRDIMRLKNLIDSKKNWEERYSTCISSLLHTKGLKEVMEGSADIIESICRGDRVVRDEKNQEILCALSELGYVTFPAIDNQVFLKVPAFNMGMLRKSEELSNWIFEQIGTEIQAGMEKLLDRADGLTSTRHQVDQQETANELWHQIFGGVNEYLVRTNLVEKPVFKPTEGRYLQSLLVLL